MRYLMHGEPIRDQITAALRQEHQLRTGSNWDADHWTCRIVFEIAHDRDEAFDLLTELGFDINERTIADPAGSHPDRTVWDVSTAHPADRPLVRTVGRQIATIDMMAPLERWRAIAMDTAVTLPVEFSQQTLGVIQDRLNAHLDLRRQAHVSPSIER